MGFLVSCIEIRVEDLDPEFVTTFEVMTFAFGREAMSA